MVRLVLAVSSITAMLLAVPAPTCAQPAAPVRHTRVSDSLPAGVGAAVATSRLPSLLRPEPAVSPLFSSRLAIDLGGPRAPFLPQVETSEPSTGAKIAIVAGVVGAAVGIFFLLRKIAGSSSGGDLPEEPGFIPIPRRSQPVRR